MRKKSPTSHVPVRDPDNSAVLGSGTITPEMQDILGSMGNYDPATQEETEKFLRDAVGKLFIAALEQMYQQQNQTSTGENEEK
jgi:hypothetical protein